MDDKEIICKEIITIWTDIGRDPKLLNIKNQPTEVLKDWLEKLKAIKMGFSILFKEGGNYPLAVHLLASTFLKEEQHEQSN